MALLDSPEFQTEVNRMMKLIINSLYRNKEIFLKELIYNASDALEKVRLQSINNSGVQADIGELSIQIKGDKDAHTLSITDTGVGMTGDEMKTKLGTIARPAVNKLLSSLFGSDVDDETGRHGLKDIYAGFKSCFLVADRVVVRSKNDEDDQHIWESDSASGLSTVVRDPLGTTLKRGTEIILYLKEEALDFLETKTLENFVRKFSQHINFKIFQWASKTETVEVDGKQEEKMTWDWCLVKKMAPIWMRKPSEIKDVEYEEFYRHLTKNDSSGGPSNGKPLAICHFSMGTSFGSAFTALLFVPAYSVPYREDEGEDGEIGTTLEMEGEEKSAPLSGIQLFVKSQMITHNFDAKMPKYLSFIHGVVDSEIRPLEHQEYYEFVCKALHSKALDMLETMKGEKMEKLWELFSEQIKHGVIKDSEHRMRLVKLLRFFSSVEDSHDTETTIAKRSLSDYTCHMKPDQKDIYYVIENERGEGEECPFAKFVVGKGYEALFLTSHYDESILKHIDRFEGKKFRNVEKEGLNFDSEEKVKKGEKEMDEAITNAYAPLTPWLIGRALKDKIDRVTFSRRLAADVPAAVVLSEKASREGESQEKTLHLNPHHKLVKSLLSSFNSCPFPNDGSPREYAQTIFDSASLRSFKGLDDLVERIEHRSTGF